MSIENSWLQKVYSDKPVDWLSIVFVDNANFRVPAWLSQKQPKGFDFNYRSDLNSPGAAQISDLWRWIEGLPTDTANATSMKVLWDRAARLERVFNGRDPGSYAQPSLSGQDVRFDYKETTDGAITLGHGEYAFEASFSGAGYNSVHMYNDPPSIEAIGLVHSVDSDTRPLDSHLSLGRSVTPKVGQTVVMMNKQGILCSLILRHVQDEVNDQNGYTSPHVIFSYQIHELI